jgi:predicted Zn finger-like uncharacterized protein
MPLTVSCPKCRASMKVDEKYLGKAGKCSKCGEQFTMTANAAEPARPAAAAVHNPFANPFAAPSGGSAAPVVAESDSRPEFLFAAPSAPEAPPAPPPTPVRSEVDWAPFGGPPPVSEPEPAAVDWAPFGGPPASPIADPPSATIKAAPEPPPTPMFAPRFDPPPVVLEMAAPTKAPFMEQRIATVEAFVVKLAGKRTLRGAAGPLIREGRATTRLYVRAPGANGGAVGWSATNPLLGLQGATVESTAAIVRRFLRPAVEGSILADLNGWQRKLDKASPSEHGPSAVAKAAVEAACLDLLANTLEAPLHVVWGGAKSKTANVAFPVDGESTKPIGDQLKRGRDRGATAFQLTFTEANEAKEKTVIAATGKAIPEGCSWSVGFMKGHPRDTALRLCDAAESAGATAVRGVLAAESAAEIARLAERTKASLIVDVEPSRAFETIAIRGIAGVVLRPNLLGWRASFAAAQMAKEAGIRAWIGLQFDGQLGLATAAHLACALGIETPILDVGRIYVDTPFVSEGENDGPFKLGDAIGVGVAVDETLLRAAAVEAG